MGKKRTVSIGARYSSYIDGMRPRKHTVFEESHTYPALRTGDDDVYAEWHLSLSDDTVIDHFTYQSLLGMFRMWGGMAVFLLAVFGGFANIYNKFWFNLQLKDRFSGEKADLREFAVEHFDHHGTRIYKTFYMPKELGSFTHTRIVPKSTFDFGKVL